MDRTPLVSSNLKSAGYDSHILTLEVEFQNGGLYSYSGVPTAVHNGLMSASSHGSYFDAYIKKAGYPFKRLI